MPQNTPMKRQFTTIDGRTVMSNLPQHWSGNDWAITGVDNPLPVGNYVQTESGVWIPQKGSDDGAADVRLTGSNIELVVLFDSVAIDSTTARRAFVPTSIANKVDEMYLVVYNTLDADVQIRYLTDIRSNDDPIRNAEGAIIEYVVPASQAFAPRIITKDDMPILANPLLRRNGDIVFLVAARTAPTEGRFSMWAFLKMGRN